MKTKEDSTRIKQDVSYRRNRAVAKCSNADTRFYDNVTPSSKVSPHASALPYYMTVSRRANVCEN